MDVSSPEVEAYLADPPAAGLGWIWDLPEPRVSIEEAIAALVKTGSPGMDTAPPSLEDQIADLEDQMAALTALARERGLIR